MRKLIQTTMVAVAFAASMTQAAPRLERAAATPALPAATAAALETIARASESRLQGADGQLIDAELARGVRELAASLDEIAADDAVTFAEVVRVKLRILQPELMRQIRLGTLEASPIGAALVELGDATARRAGEMTMQAPRPDGHETLGGPVTGCFAELANCWEHCSNLDTTLARTICGLDCEVDFLACVGILDPPTYRPSAGFNP